MKVKKKREPAEKDSDGGARDLKLVDVSVINRHNHDDGTTVEQPADEVRRIQQVLPALLIELQALTQHVDHNVHHNGGGTHVHDRGAHQFISILCVNNF